MRERVGPLLPKYRSSRARGRPRVDRRRVLEGILYVLRTGCQWKAALAEPPRASRRIVPEDSRADPWKRRSRGIPLHLHCRSGSWTPRDGFVIDCILRTERLRRAQLLPQPVRELRACHLTGCQGQNDSKL